MELGTRTIDSVSFLRGAAFETILCNLCGGTDFRVLAEEDGIGLPVRTVMCRACGLIAINPRLTKQWYGEYYRYVNAAREHYKHGHENEKQKLGSGFAAAMKHGRAFAERLRPYILGGVTIDVGSAEGGLLAGMRDLVGIEPIGIEPTESRVLFANQKGIRSYACLIEDVERVVPHLPRAANIVCTKSLNHLLDPAFFFSWAHRMLVPDGRLFLEVKNFRQQCRMSGRVRFGIQIDHPFMFTPETLAAFVRRAGFTIMHLEVDETKNRSERDLQRRSGLPVGHIRLAAMRTEREPFAEELRPEPGLVERLSREFSPNALFFHYLLHYANIRENLARRIGLAR